MTFRFVWLAILWGFLLPKVWAVDFPEVLLPSHLSGENILVLYKQFNSSSKKIAEYYAEQRHVPLSQVVAVPIFASPSNINQQKFDAIYQQLSPHITENIKVILLTWHAPYRVECMSITSAFALGFDTKYCSRPNKTSIGCHRTANSSYFNSSLNSLWQQDSNIKLSMMLSGKTLLQAKELIDRGVAADGTQPTANAYLVRTYDGARSTRWPIFKQFADIWGDRNGVNVQYIDDRGSKSDTQIRNKLDIMFYHTGLAHVPAINTNTYLPGAIADHLTSGAGIGIGHSGQMKAFRWLEAGATASYGAVVEPCNYPEKFPNPQILIPAYVAGDTLIEAYWKSVQQPGEALFIGEPLARPWAKTHTSFNDEYLIIRSAELDLDKTYILQSQLSESSPWQTVKAKMQRHDNVLEIRTIKTKIERYRIIEKP